MPHDWRCCEAPHWSAITADILNAAALQQPDMIQQLLSEDADLDNSLVLLRDFIRDLFAPSDVDEPTPEEETIEEAIEDPDELLDAS